MRVVGTFENDLVHEPLCGPLEEWINKSSGNPHGEEQCNGLRAQLAVRQQRCDTADKYSEHQTSQQCEGQRTLQKDISERESEVLIKDYKGQRQGSMMPRSAEATMDRHPHGCSGEAQRLRRQTSPRPITNGRAHADLESP